MTDWTPGPWHLEYGDVHTDPQNNEGFTIILTELGNTIHEFQYAEGIFPEDAEWSEAQANARLIAAAPDLYAALEAAIDVGLVPKSSAVEGGANKHSEQVRVADQIRAALAKARGESE